ncbi:hypothetical protein ASD06_11015 [Angustibacter sp. Root456]|nr:hypothetical protein ASD06_11015 [Angustibacter sp. Root456]
MPELLEALEDRSFTTYKCRIRAYERIQGRSRAWNAALISLATATTVAAIGLLVDDSMYGASGETLLAACSVLALAASLVVASLDYPGRAVRVEVNYKEIQDIASRIQAARSVNSQPTLANYYDLHGSYSDLVRHSENHTSGDRDAYEGNISWSRFFTFALTFLPYATFVLPMWLFWQFGAWVIHGSG